MKHCMIDLETLSDAMNACIVSIGACKFDTDGRILETFYRNVSAKSCKSFGLDINKSTIDWWAKQPKETRETWQKDPIELDLMVAEFIEWYGAKKIPIWSNGADFDIPILTSAIKAVSETPPWSPWGGRCVRTVMALTGTKVDRSEGTYHNALDDAINQAKYVANFLKLVEESKS